MSNESAAGEYYLDAEGKNLVPGLQIRYNADRKNARHNYFAAYACYVVAVLSSIASTLVLAAAPSPFPLSLKTIVALLTATPAATLLVNNVFAFDRKADWYYKKANKWNAISMRIRYEKLSIKKASEEIREFDARMEGLYPRFGVMPHQPAQKSQDGE